MIRRFADQIGLDPWDVSLARCDEFASSRELPPVSRYRLGSPCRFIRRLDYLIHIVLPEAVEERHPWWATYLRATSPRWGRSWRGWETS